MLIQIHFLVSPFLKGRCEGEQRGQRLGFRDYVTRLATAPATMPRVEVRAHGHRDS
jgi:hypothetical protein